MTSTRGRSELRRPAPGEGRSAQYGSEISQQTDEQKMHHGARTDDAGTDDLTEPKIPPEPLEQGGTGGISVFIVPQNSGFVKVSKIKEGKCCFKTPVRNIIRQAVTQCSARSEPRPEPCILQGRRPDHDGTRTVQAEGCGHDTLWWKTFFAALAEVIITARFPSRSRIC